MYGKQGLITFILYVNFFSCSLIKLLVKLDIEKEKYIVTDDMWLL